MGLFIQQNDNRSKLQERIAADLREKAKSRANQDLEAPDGVDDSKYMEGTKRTTSLAWIWVIIAVAAVVIIVWAIVMTSNSAGTSL